MTGAKSNSETSRRAASAGVSEAVDDGGTSSCRNINSSSSSNGDGTHGPSSDGGDDSSSSSSDRYKVLETWSPFPCMHPTRAILQDRITKEFFEWNSRAHRKLRDIWYTDARQLEEQRRKTPFKWGCYEPHLITWWVTLSNMMANVWWVVNGTYGLWPNASPSDDRSAKITYAGAILGGFFMILTNYLTVVEAINNTHAAIRRPKHQKKGKKQKRRIFQRANKVYGFFKSPIGYDNHGLDSLKARRHLLHMGYPYIENPATGKLITTEDYHRAITKFLDPSTTRRMESKASIEEGINDDEKDSTTPFIGAKVNINDCEFVCTTRVEGVSRSPDLDLLLSRQYYDWWSWHPAWNQVGVLSAYIGLVCALLYFIPMCAGYPLSKRQVSQGVELFFVDLLQLFTHLVFAFTAHLSIAEAAGSWWKPKLNSIGYYIGIFNAIGSWGFALCGGLLIPDTVGSSCCPNAGYASSLACFIGGSAYFVAGILMWFEFSNPDPIALSVEASR